MKNGNKAATYYMSKMNMINRIKRCYKTDAELAAEQQELFLTKVKSEVENQLKSLKTDLVEKKSLKEVQDKLTAIEAKSASAQTKEDYEKLVGEINSFGLKIKALEERPKKKSAKPLSFKEAIKKEYLEKKSQIDELIAGTRKSNVVLDLKSAITITDAATIEAVGSASHWSLTSYTGIISKIRKRITRYLESVSVGGLSIDRPFAMWIEELDEQGTPIFIAEAEGKTKLSVRYEEREMKAKKIAVYAKVSTEMLKFLPQLISYIESNLMKRMDIVTEDQLFDGDNTGNNLKGILSYATAFDGGVGVAGGPGLVGKVFNPSTFDVMRAVALQVENSYGIPNRVFVRPEVMAEMDVAKNTEGTYLLPPFISASGKVVAGIELVPSQALNATSYDFVGGDMSVVHVSFLENPNIQIGMDGNDFTNNLRTILMEQMLVQFVSANDVKVLVKGTIADAKALLTT